MNVPAWLEPPFGPLSGLHARLLTAPDMDWSAVPLFAVAMAPMAVQAYLIVQPHTRPLRAALGAHGLVLLTHAWMRYRFTDPTWAFLNAATTLFYLFGVLRYAEWMCISDPIVDPRLLTSSSLGNRLLSAVDLCINQRCVGLASVGLDGTHGRANRTLKSAYASPAHPAPWAPTSRLRSVARHAWAAGWRYAVADVVIAFQRSLGAESIAKPGGAPGAIDAFVRTWGRGMGGEVAAWLFAMLLIPAVASLLISTAYHVIAALAVATAWEADAWDTPMFDSFLLADSLNDLWGRRWHQIIRHQMVTLSTLASHLLPASLRTRTLQFSLVFTFSALLHILAHLSMDPVPSAPKIGGFFVLSGLGCALERSFRALTGRRVHGVVGWAWTWAFMLGTGRMCADAWLDAGFATAWTRLPRFGLGDALVGAVGFEVV